MSVREWVELCNKEDYRAPGIREVNLAHRTAPAVPRPRIQRRRKEKRESVSVEEPDADLQVKAEATDDVSMLEESLQVEGIPSQMLEDTGPTRKAKVKEEPKSRPKRTYPSRETREANLADRAARDQTFIDAFEPHSAWLPSATESEDYTPEFCQQLERRFWRGLGFGGKPAWYGADTQGIYKLYSAATTLTIIRLLVHGCHQGVECGPPSFRPITSVTIDQQRPSWGEYSISVFWNVASDICMACRRYGFIQHQLHTFRSSQVLVCNPSGEGSGFGAGYEKSVRLCLCVIF